MNTRLLIDTVCWVALTTWLLLEQYNVAAALVGSFAIIYVYRAVRIILRWKAFAAQVEAEIEKTLAELEKGE